MKDYIDNSKSYSLEDVNSLMSKVEDKEKESENIGNTEEDSTTMKNRNHLFASVIAASIASASLAKSDLSVNWPNISYEAISEADKNYKDYITFLIAQSGTVSNNKNELIEEVLSFKSLKENWDGYGAIPSENKAAANAIDLIYKLKPSVLNKISSVFPTTNGTVAFVWENRDDERVSFEIGENNYSYYTQLNNLKPSFFEGVVSDENWVLELETNVLKL